MPADFPIVFIGGPSGAGKEYVSRHLAEAKGLEWLELDTPGRDAVVDLGLRNEWASIWQGKTAPLFAELRSLEACIGDFDLATGYPALLPVNCFSI